MWNIFRRKNKQQREVQKLSYTFAILDNFARRGLIFWKMKDKMLLIEESLAVIKLAEGADGFQHFLDQAAQWQNFQLIQEAYEAYRIDVETKAVREVQKQYPNLDKEDIQRIRQNARMNMPEIDPDKMDTVHEFDILIIRANAPSRKDATTDDGSLLAVGHYDGRHVEMAMYDDIRNDVMGKENERP